LTALLYASRDGCYDCVEALIAKGADVDLPTPEGVTPLMIALDNDNNDIAKLLLDRGANPGLWDWYGRTALFIAVDRKDGGSSAGVTRVPVDPSHSARFSAMDVIKALLAANVDPSPELRMHRPTRGGYTGRFSDPLQDTGCTPLLRATWLTTRKWFELFWTRGFAQHQRDGSHAIPGRGRRRNRRTGRWRGEHSAHGPAPSTRRGCECSSHRHKDVFHA
jgi:hypothetical protein